MQLLKSLCFATAIAAVAFVSCKKETEIGPEQQPTTTTTTTTTNSVDTSLYFKGTIDGSAVAFYPDTIYTNTLGDTVGTVPKGKEYRPFSYIVRLNKKNGTALNKPNSGGMAIIFDTTSAYGNISANYRNIIKVQSYSYGKMSKSTSSNGTNGGYIFYIDNSGTEWTTDKGTADQTGSTFTVTSYTDLGTTTAPYKKVKASFSCKLYDGKGNVKTVTNGSFSGKIMTY